jgi:hypothetical protein
MEQRIDGFKQIEAFYSWVFNNPDKARPTHISLYLFLWNQNNRAHWCEWFKCPYDLAMQGACIGNNGTYYKCLDELKNWGLIKYQKGTNNFKAPLVSIIQLYKNEQLSEQVTVPLSEQQTAQQYAQQTEQLPAHIYKLITDNIEQIENNFEKVKDFVLSLSEKEGFNFKSELLKLGVSEQIATDWMAVRKAKKASNTPTAFSGLLKQIQLSGLPPNECIRMAAERSWTGFNAEWVKDKQTPQQPKQDEPRPKYFRPLN